MRKGASLCIFKGVEVAKSQGRETGGPGGFTFC